jgi:hypothetical protein
MGCVCVGGFVVASRLWSSPLRRVQWCAGLWVYVTAAGIANITSLPHLSTFL